MRELATTVGFMDASIADYLRHVHRDYQSRDGHPVQCDRSTSAFSPLFARHFRHYFASTDLANNDEKNH
jgi:hypothetical protein